MKKFFKKAFVCLSIMGMGLTTTSCDSETIATILQTFLPNIIGMFQGNFNNGTTYTGTYTLQVLKGNYQTEEYAAATDLMKFEGTSCVVQVQNGTASIQLPGTTIADGYVLSEEVQLGSLVASNGKIEVGDDGLTGTGSLTVNGNKLDIANAYVDATYTEQTFIVKQISLYFGDGSYVVNVTFDGKVEIEEEKKEEK